MNLNQVTLPASNVGASVAFYRRMGFTLIVSSPHDARFECPQGDATFSVHLAHEICADTGVVVYFECPDLDERVALLQAQGFLSASSSRKSIGCGGKRAWKTRPAT